MELPTKLFHYSKHEIPKLLQDYHNKCRKDMAPMGKPWGFWLSIEDYENDQNWKTWCEGEEFRLCGLKYRYAVKLKPSAKILFISTTDELEAFSLKYKGNDIEDYRQFTKIFDDPPYIYHIKWEDIYALYDGIIIAPYNWGCRMGQSTSWYYGWDCASGCIWNIDAMEPLILESVNEAITEQVCQEEENAKDSRLEGLVQSRLIVPLEYKA